MLKRIFEKSIICFLVLLLIVGALPIYALDGSAETNGDNNYTSNQGDLIEEAFIMLPLGATEATGFLKEQMLLQKQGITGAMELYDNYGPNSGWLGGTGENWEKGPYYVRALVSLAYTLNDDELKQRAQKWIDWSINSQRADGFFGPTNNTDWWPRMPMLMAIRDYYEATEYEGNPDERVIPFMEKYFRYQLEKLPSDPLSGWGAARGGDNIETVYWLYNRLYDKNKPEDSQWLLELATLIKNQTQNWTNIYSTTTVRHHVVNTSQALKMPVLYYQQSGNETDRNAFEKGLFNIAIDHGRVDGMPNADEGARDNRASVGTELCGVVEGMLSTEIAISILGEAWMGDRLESMAYNSLPTFFAPDYLGNAYYTAQNQVMATAGYHEFEQDHGDDVAFGAPSGFECCFPNGQMGWGKYVQSMWMATNNNGLAAIAYGPNKVTAKVEDGKTAVFTQNTNYPFDEAIELEYSGENASFELKLRIPEWCNNPAVSVNGQAQTGVVSGSFFTIDRAWTSGDKVEITFPMEIEISTWYNDSVAVQRGPLLYGLKIKQDWREYNDNEIRGINTEPRGGLKNREVYPLSRWNYGLIVDEENPADSFTVVKRDVADQPFDVGTAPVIIKAKGQILPNWTLDGNNVATYSFGKTEYDESMVEDIELIPFGCTRLRIALFPKIGRYTNFGVYTNVKTTEKDGKVIQEIDNIMVPEAEDYRLRIRYTGEGKLNLELNGKTLGEKTFTGSGVLAISEVKSLISDEFFRFSSAHYNNLRLIGNDDIKITSVDVYPINPITDIEIKSVETGAGYFTVNTNLTRTISPYKIIYSTEAGLDTNIKTASGFKGGAATITGLEKGTYYFKVTAMLGGKEVQTQVQSVEITEDNSNTNIGDNPNAVAPETAITDDFSNPSTSNSNWIKYGNASKMNVENGKFVFGYDQKIKTVLNGGYEWNDYAVEATITLTSFTEYGNAGIIFRATNPADGPDDYNGYYFGIANGKAMVGYGQYGWFPMKDIPYNISYNNAYRLKVLVSGDLMGFYVDDELVYSMRDSRFAKGTVGFRSYEQPFTADDFEIRPLNDADRFSLHQILNPTGFDITGTRAASIIQIRYPVINGATAYKFEYGTQSGNYTHEIYDINSNGFRADKSSIGGVIDGEDYFVRVTVLNGKNEVGSSKEIKLSSVSYEQAKPTGIVPVAASDNNTADGKITGVTPAMEYRHESDTEYKPCTSDEITGLAAGTYYIRFAETDKLLPSEDVVVVVTSGSALIGDLNGDGKLTVADVVKLRSIIMGDTELTDELKTLADINKDNTITVTDIVKLRGLIMGD